MRPKAQRKNDNPLLDINHIHVLFCRFTMSDKRENIKARILFPMILAGAFLIFLSLIGGYWLQQKAIDDSVHQRISGVHRLFEAFLHSLHC